MSKRGLRILTKSHFSVFAGPPRSGQPLPQRQLTHTRPTDHLLLRHRVTALSTSEHTVDLHDPSKVLRRGPTVSSYLSSDFSHYTRISTLASLLVNDFADFLKNLSRTITTCYRTDEVNFLRDRRRKHTNKKQKTEHSKRRQKSKSSTKPVVS
ncbi:hypothetical protein MJO28_005888 [Puccinia striiformis f. sp. tritici]|uniref:Uncharacterized protein n=1 Tax=Puccinia striiformis f. sp. tritici TaxID=168172 RepID=A0ACC0EFG7_9BASI|nr:hypothetical protein MJO28_005888 [Puccinia striiformis f. sp. tritici]